MFSSFQDSVMLLYVSRVSRSGCQSSDISLIKIMKKKIDVLSVVTRSYLNCTYIIKQDNKLFIIPFRRLKLFWSLMRTFLKQVCLSTGFIDFPVIRLTYNGRYIAKLWWLFVHSLYSSFNLFFDIVNVRDWKPAVALRRQGYFMRGCLVFGRWPCSVKIGVIRRKTWKSRQQQRRVQRGIHLQKKKKLYPLQVSTE